MFLEIHVFFICLSGSPAHEIETELINYNRLSGRRTATFHKGNNTGAVWRVLMCMRQRKRREETAGPWVCVRCL
jgi:hypothetical protein